ncbi:MAG: DUF3524 domain-containing protein [Cyanobacteria bacterium P01_E01_bin.34]
MLLGPTDFAIAVSTESRSCRWLDDSGNGACKGGALELAQQVIHYCKKHGKPDCLIVTDMTNLPALLALSRPYLDGVPTLLYAHENQLTYPMPPGEKQDLTYAAINMLSMVTAEAIAFNSDYHRTEFFDELPRLLRHFPDYNHLEVIPRLQEKSTVLPVGLNLYSFDNHVAPSQASKPHKPLRIVWNQRWEYDKNPAEFFQALYTLVDKDVSFEVVVAGENFRQQPTEFAEARKRLGDRIVHFGYAKSVEAYSRLLLGSDVVVSTAYHEFFGISILEAMYCNCYPLLPHRLSYPELIPLHIHEQHLYRDFDDLCDRLVLAAQNCRQIRSCSLRSIAQQYEWQVIAPQYDSALARVAVGNL